MDYTKIKTFKPVSQKTKNNTFLTYSPIKDAISLLTLSALYYIVYIIVAI